MLVAQEVHIADNLPSFYMHVFYPNNSLTRESVDTLFTLEGRLLTVYASQIPDFSTMFV